MDAIPKGYVRVIALKGFDGPRSRRYQTGQETLLPRKQASRLQTGGYVRIIHSERNELKDGSGVLI